MHQSTFVNGEAILRSICRSAGNVQLRSLTSEDVTSFLNKPRNSSLTQRGQYSILNGFLRYWISREAMTPLALTKPTRGTGTFVPHIYSVEQVRALLATTRKSQVGSKSMNANTLRVFLLMLYATGASSGEVLALRVSDLSPRCTHLTFQNQNNKHQRRIPLCPDLQKQLRSYLAVKSKADSRSSQFLFCSATGARLSRCYLMQCFRRLQKIAGVVRRDTTMPLPRMQDFRASFAVERLTCWLKQGSDLNLLLPALSTYMGYSNLSSADKFLPLVPEGFTSDLIKLSPKTKRKRWREDAAVMNVLNNL